VRTILKSPDDDAPRLVFADWLDEHGQADAAELIRVECAMAAGDGSPDLGRHYRLRERAAAAVAPFARPLGAHVEFVRGLPEHLYLWPNSDWGRGLRRLCRELPILALDLLGVDDLPRAAAALGRTARARLRSLRWDAGDCHDRRA